MEVFFYDTSQYEYVNHCNETAASVNAPHNDHVLKKMASLIEARAIATDHRVRVRPPITWTILFIESKRPYDHDIAIVS